MKEGLPIWDAHRDVRSLHLQTMSGISFTHADLHHDLVLVSPLPSISSSAVLTLCCKAVRILWYHQSLVLVICGFFCDSLPFTGTTFLAPNLASVLQASSRRCKRNFFIQQRDLQLCNLSLITLEAPWKSEARRYTDVWHIFWWRCIGEIFSWTICLAPLSVSTGTESTAQKYPRYRVHVVLYFARLENLVKKGLNLSVCL